MGGGIAGRLTRLLVVAAGVGTLIFGVYVTRAIERHGILDLEARLTTEARLLDGAVAPALARARGGPDAALQAEAQRYGRILGTRVTVVAADGTVVADSERDLAGVRAMENHAGRPEIRAALAGGRGRSVRRSDTLQVPMLYVAVPIEGDGAVAGVLRLALHMPEVARAVTWARLTVAAGAALALAVAAAVGFFVSRRVTRPVAAMRRVAHRMAQGQFDEAVPVEGNDEVADLGRALNRMAVSLREKIETLEGERAKVAAILDGMVEGVIALDARGRVMLMNPGAREILGVGDEPVAGRPLLEVVRQKELLDLAEASRASQPGSPLRRELPLGPPLDRILAAHAVAADFAAPGAGGPGGHGTLLVLHDVTELRRLERVKTEFVANVSHELRTPLTCIRGYLETLLDGALEDSAHARRFLEVASAHADRLNRLVDDLLELSNIETGRVRLAPVSLALREVAAGVVATFEAQAARKGVELGADVPSSLRVRADPDRLSQILLNLVDNAVKFTPAGGRITLAAAAASAGLVEIRVTDTGIGIPSTDLPRLTERFYRVDKARPRDPAGTGLGLAIVKHLVQAHGGELGIDSELGKGTTVRFTLPAA